MLLSWVTSSSPSPRRPIACPAPSSTTSYGREVLGSPALLIGDPPGDCSPIDSYILISSLPLDEVELSRLIEFDLR